MAVGMTNSPRRRCARCGAMWGDLSRTGRLCDLCAARPEPAPAAPREPASRMKRCYSCGAMFSGEPGRVGRLCDACRPAQ